MNWNMLLFVVFWRMAVAPPAQPRMVWHLLNGALAGLAVLIDYTGGGFLLVASVLQLWRFRNRPQAIVVFFGSAFAVLCVVFAYNTNGFAFHRLEDVVAILADLGYAGVALTPDVHHLNPVGTPDGFVQVERDAKVGGQVVARAGRQDAQPGAAIHVSLHHAVDHLMHGAIAPDGDDHVVLFLGGLARQFAGVPRILGRCPLKLVWDAVEVGLVGRCLQHLPDGVAPAPVIAAVGLGTALAPGLTCCAAPDGSAASPGRRGIDPGFEPPYVGLHRSGELASERSS